MDLRDYLVLVARNWIILAVTVAVGLATAGANVRAEHGLLTRIVHRGPENEPAPGLWGRDRPSGERPRDLDHVLLRVAAVDA